jgi:hypothetical protein
MNIYRSSVSWAGGLLSVAIAKSLTRIGSFKWVLAYRSLPNTQAKIPKQNSDTATTAKGNGGNQIGMLCISKASDKCCNHNVATETPSQTDRLKLTFAARQPGGGQCECALPGNKRQ